MASMRQLGVGGQGGAEAFAIFQQLLYDEWAAGRLEKPFGAGQSRRTKLFRGAAIERNPKGRARESPQASRSYLLEAYAAVDGATVWGRRPSKGQGSGAG